MRIALVAPLVTTLKESQLGGSQAFVSDLARGLTGRGHSVDVYAAKGSRIPEVNVVDLGIDSEPLTPALYRVRARESPDSGITEAAFATVFAHVRKVPYDVVHNHAFDAPAIRLATVLDAPVAHTLHLPPTTSIVEALVEAGRSPRPPVVATVSEFCAKAWRTLTHIDAILRPHVPTSRIPWMDRPGKHAVFAGRLTGEKGAAEAIEIASAAGLEIDLYGDPYDPDYVRRRLDRRRYEPGIRIHAALPRGALWERMARASVVLCPALWDEPFGMAAAEAQACGTPVVAFRRGGLPENVADGVSGILINPGDVTAATQAVGRATALSRTACRGHAEANLDLEASLDAHEALYQSIVGSRTGLHA